MFILGCSSNAEKRRKDYITYDLMFKGWNRNCAIKWGFDKNLLLNSGERLIIEEQCQM